MPLDVIVKSAAQSPQDALDIEDVEVMQYTGLKDKNGREIYEGDVVTAYRNGRNQPVVGQITYVTNECAFRLNDRTYLHRLDYLNRHEAIGNIYENPELLDEDRRPHP